MSHARLRKENDCLNCGATLQGRFCHDCGQQNVVPKESFWHMAAHFLYDITHFDSKFFDTVHKLVLKPGFLTREYMEGRRVRYLHPVKMYVFTSALFFLLFFSIFTAQIVFKSNGDDLIRAEARRELIVGLEKELAADPANEKLIRNLGYLLDTTLPLTQSKWSELNGSTAFGLTGTHFKSIREYDSVQNSLPASRRDSWFSRKIIKNEIELNEQYRKNPDESLMQVGDKVLHKLPYMLFVSLPLFALMLKLVYYRRKQFIYVDHGVFTLHLFVFTFILMTAAFTLSKLENALNTGYINLLVALLVLGLFVYLYRAMQIFYGQGWAKTLVKFLVIALLSLIMMLGLFIIFSFITTFLF